MVVFAALLAINAIAAKIDNRRAPEFWVYPAQTIMCSALLVWFRREYRMEAPRRPLFALFTGAIVFAIWISPQAFFGSAARLDGFNPDLLSSNVLYWAELVLRFVRLVVVVPLVEEIFWRGFLLRVLIDDDFDRVPFGTFSWPSFSIVTIAFALSHAPPDWPAALVAGALYNVVAYRTKSLSSCVVAHAVTNMFLGLWIMQTKQWGFW